MRLVRVLGKLEPGGAQLAVLRLSRELELRHDVHTTLLVGDATQDGLALARRYGVRPVAFRCGAAIHPSRNLQWQQSGRFAAWLADGLAGADLVHAHMIGAWWAAAQSIGDSTPLFATEHNEVNWTSRQVAALRPAAARVDRFYAMGPAARRFAVQAGVRPDVIEAARSPIAGLHGIPRHGLATPRLTFVGRLCHDKAPDVLLDAVALLRRENLTVYLLGAGPLQASLVERIGRLGLSARVIMPGWVDEPWTYVAGSSVHVVPSREEAWSQSAVLALGLGVPVVGTRVDGLADTLSRSRGVLVPSEDPSALSDAIAAVLEGQSTVDVDGARTYARRFATANVADFYHSAYLTTMSGQWRQSPTKLPMSELRQGRGRVGLSN